LKFSTHGKRNQASLKVGLAYAGGKEGPLARAPAWVGLFYWGWKKKRIKQTPKKTNEKKSKKKNPFRPAVPIERNEGCPERGGGGAAEISVGTFSKRVGGKGGPPDKITAWENALYPLTVYFCGPSRWGSKQVTKSMHFP